MTDGLKDAHREAIIAEIAANDRVERAVLFGSRATGTNTVSSDVDIALFGERLTLTDQARLAAALDKIPMAQTLDLLLYDSIGDRTLREHIRNHGVEWYERPSSMSADPENWPATYGESSGVEAWRGSTWGEEIALEYGKALRGYDLGTGPFRVFGSNGPIGWTDEALVPGPGVILGRKGAYRGVEYSTDPFFVIDTAYYVVSKSRHEMRWLFYAIKHYKLGEIDDGSPVPSTTRAAVYPRGLKVPPRSEQSAIAHILGTLDDKIELNRRMTETLEAMARALFKSWFVDFDPVRAKIDGRDAGLPPDIAALFPSQLVDSELGEVPEGWTVFRLDQLANHHTKSTSPARSPRLEYEHFSIPAYDAGQHPAIEPGADIRSNKTVVLKDAVLLSKLNPRISRVWVPADSTGRPQICSTEFLAFTPRPPANKSLLFTLFRDRRFRTLLESLVTGTSKSHQRVPPKALKAHQVLAGSPRVFTVFGEVIGGMLTRILKNRSEAATLATLRNTLLPKLISGEVRTRDAKSFAPNISSSATRGSA
ncbi:restriction endonuclease subunit S [Candidatus Palauibacter sp.]|uniref:restriction endonuclease subunit S n=1 Tax=Candidatus Palauibacter sp. TaxID=3101350 RepID=UPI003B5C3B78